MKRYFYLLLIPLLFSCNGMKKDDGYTVSVTADQEIDGYVFLQKRIRGSLTNIDSALLQGEPAKFTGKVEFPEVYFINIPETKSLIPFFIENTRINIEVNTAQIDKSTIKGSTSQDAYEVYLNSLERFDSEVQEAYTLLRKAEDFGDLKKSAYYDSVIDATYDRKKDYIKRYLINNGNKVISPYITYRNSYQFELNDLEEIVAAFDESVKPSVYVTYLDEFMNILRRASVGQMYITFTMNDTAGQRVPIADHVRGQYTLIDFWASWCAPCRKENPALVTIYRDFKDKGFEIVGVSLDTSEESWKQAIESDNLTWPQLSDLRGWNSSAARLYGIRSIPANVLIDKQGYILKRNLRAKELRETLENIFKSNV